MKKPIKVLQVMSSLNLANGVSSFIMNYFRRINHKEIIFDFLLLHDEKDASYSEEVLKSGSRIFILPPINHPARHISVCREIIVNGHYDIIHDNSLILTIPLMLIAKRENVPVRILHSHNSKMGDTRIKSIRNNLLLPLLRLTATDYFACSKLAGEAMFGKAPFTVIPNVIDANRLQFDNNKRLQIRKKMGVSEKVVVATVARAAYQKNPFFALEIIKAFIDICPNVLYWWVGNGPLESEMQSYASKLGISDHVAFLGRRTDVTELYQAMDAFLLPSLFEGLPLTGVEAQAMGLPCVVSDTVTDEMTYTDLVAYVSLKESPKRWAEKILDNISKRADRNKYNQLLKDSVFSNLKCGERLTEVYLSLMR